MWPQGLLWGGPVGRGPVQGAPSALPLPTSCPQAPRAAAAPPGALGEGSLAGARLGTGHAEFLGLAALQGRREEAPRLLQAVLESLLCWWVWRGAWQVPGPWGLEGGSCPDLGPPKGQRGARSWKEASCPAVSPALAAHQAPSVRQMSALPPSGSVRPGRRFSVRAHAPDVLSSCARRMPRCMPLGPSALHFQGFISGCVCPSFSALPGILVLL